MKFDFHIHSVFSDGSSTIEEIFKISKEKGLSAIAITDHDTVLGLEQADKLSKEYNIPFVLGIEFTVVEDNTKFHVLGYNIDYKSLELKQYSQNLLNYLNAKSKKQIKLMQNNGINIEEHEFFKQSQGGPLYRAKLLKTLSNYGYIKKEDIMNSLNIYLGKNAPYYVEDTYKYLNFEEACKLIKRNNGIIVLAHPGKIKKKNLSLYEGLINNDLLDGIEIYHPSNDLDVQEELIDIVTKKNMIFTGGSDYHGKYNKRKTPICGISMPDKVYDNMYMYLRNK